MRDVFDLLISDKLIVPLFVQSGLLLLFNIRITRTANSPAKIQHAKVDSAIFFGIVNFIVLCKICSAYDYGRDYLIVILFTSLIQAIIILAVSFTGEQKERLPLRIVCGICAASALIIFIIILRPDSKLFDFVQNCAEFPFR